MLTANIIWWNMRAKVPNVGEAFCTTLDTFTENFSMPQFPNKIYRVLCASASTRIGGYYRKFCSIFDVIIQIFIFLIVIYYLQGKKIIE